MSSYILFLILGLGAGAIYAILGQGLVLKYRSAGVVDFAHGAVAMFIAYVFVNLRVVRGARAARGADPASDLAERRRRDRHDARDRDLARVRGDPRPGPVLPRLPAAARRDAAHPRVRVGRVMLALQAIAVLNYGTQPVATNPIFPTAPLSISGVTFPEDRLFFAGVVIVISVVLALDLPLHALRARHAGRRRERPRRRAHRHLGQPGGGAELGHRHGPGGRRRAS